MANWTETETWRTSSQDIWLKGFSWPWTTVHFTMEKVCNGNRVLALNNTFWLCAHSYGIITIQCQVVWETANSDLTRVMRQPTFWKVFCTKTFRFSSVMTRKVNWIGIVKDVHSGKVRICKNPLGFVFAEFQLKKQDFDPNSVEFQHCVVHFFAPGANQLFRSREHHCFWPQVHPV